LVSHVPCTGTTTCEFTNEGCRRHCQLLAATTSLIVDVAFEETGGQIGRMASVGNCGNIELETLATC